MPNRVLFYFFSNKILMEENMHTPGIINIFMWILCKMYSMYEVLGTVGNFVFPRWLMQKLITNDGSGIAGVSAVAGSTKYVHKAFCLGSMLCVCR